MIVIEEWSWINGIRVTDKKEYNSVEDWERDLFINTLKGTHVGYKIYECTMAEFDSMNTVQRGLLMVKQKFDKEAYIGEYPNEF